MEELAGVRDGMLAFYERFSSGDAEAFAAGIADVPGVSVIGSGLDEGHTERGDWISTYAAMMAGEMKGTRLEGNSPRGGRRDRSGSASTSQRSCCLTEAGFRRG